MVDSERFVCTNLSVTMHSQPVLANRQCMDVRPWLITSCSSSCSYRIQLQSSTYMTPLQLGSSRRTRALRNSSSRIVRRRGTEEFKDGYLSEQVRWFGILLKDEKRNAFTTVCSIVENVNKVQQSSDSSCHEHKWITGSQFRRCATACSSCGIKLNCSIIEPQERFHPMAVRGPHLVSTRKGWHAPRAMYVDDDDEGGLIDAPMSVGDGFSFTGGKYSDEKGQADEWFARGSIVRAYPVEEGLKKTTDPLFGLVMGEASQTSTDSFRWFYVEEGDRKNPTVLLAHGYPSQAYSYREVLPLLTPDYHVIAFDWLGFGFSDKPQPKYGFNYTTVEYATALGLLVDALGLKDFTLVVQGYFVPAALLYAKSSEERVNQLILINPPVTDEHAKLPSALAAFSTFLLGEIFAQDPLKASDKPLSECGPYMMDEEDAMVYRRPYLTSGASGFALTALSRALKTELKGSVRASKELLSPETWRNRVSVIWGLKDRWLDYSGVEDFAKSINARLVQLPEVGHHAQEDFGEEVGKTLRTLLRRALV